MTWRTASCVTWLVWLAYWIVAARNAERANRQAEGAGSRVLHFTLLIASIVLVYGPPVVGPMSFRWKSLAWLGSGLALQVAGLLLAVVARVHLGRNRGGAVQVKAHHEVVSSGPYAVVRHPIYAGILVAVVGSALASGTSQALLAIPVCLIAYLRKVRMEERFLAESLGSEYEAYQRSTGALIPGPLGWVRRRRTSG